MMQQLDGMARIGPNAIVQAQAAMRALGRDQLAQTVLKRAGLGHYVDAPPTAMVPQSEVAALFEAMSASVAPGELHRLLHEAGLRTGDYILAHRIPMPAQRLLRRCPRAGAARLLLAAMSRHAWTFAGDGDVSCGYGLNPCLSISRNPIATPGCPWHVAVFERLFGVLVDARVKVRHECCHARGADVCRFDIVLP